MIMEGLEIASVILTTYGVFCTTSGKSGTRRSGFILLMFACVCSILVFHDKALFYMLAQSVVFMAINVRGIVNNPLINKEKSIMKTFEYFVVEASGQFLTEYFPSMEMTDDERMEFFIGTVCESEEYTLPDELLSKIYNLAYTLQDVYSLGYDDGIDSVRTY